MRIVPYRTIYSWLIGFQPGASVERGRRNLLLRRSRSFEILTDPQTVAGFVDEVRAHADAHRNELGFLAAQAYEIAAHNGNLFVAVESGGGQPRYSGHLLFGRTYPHAKIHQAYVVSEARRTGLGRQLVQSLVKLAEREQFLSVSAKVAADLPANEFYEAQGFETLRKRLGGASRRRMINVRVKQLNTPALFGYRAPVTGLPLSEPMPNFTPAFVIDLNVFFDVARRRPRAEFGAVIMSASFSNLIRLAVTEEFANELKRSSTGAPDPILEFALQLPTIPTPRGGVERTILDELGRLVFPERAAAGNLTIQDKSDLLHLAIALHHKVTGFVTAEDALVAASPTIEARFGLRLVHVRNLAESIKSATTHSSPLEIGFSESDLRLSEAEELAKPSLVRLAKSMTIPEDVRGIVLAEGIHATSRKCLTVTLGDDVICAAFWRHQAGFDGTINAVILTDDEQASAEVAADALLNKLATVIGSPIPKRLQLQIPNACLVGQQIALRCGFTKCSTFSSEMSRFQRLSLGAVVTRGSWPSVQRDLRKTADMTFPAHLPAMSGDDVRIPFETSNGKAYEIDLFDLETGLSPTMFVLEGRCGVLVPIQSRYANQLLDTGLQRSFFAEPHTVALHERLYFSAPRNRHLFRRGVVMVFYESGSSNGRSAAIAVARVRSTVIVTKQQVAPAMLQYGVLDEVQLSTISVGSDVAATSFDNVLKLNRPVGLDRLRQLGCIDGSNAVTSRAINFDQLDKIIREGMATGE